ncbi:PREDICTED: uncharacterized protein LOC105575684 isoform X2 [Cercocebus atys]|uniref:uncharacterized protein LOC105575684 isoform X2 n=1 Tax=Cercocebus atys TaxID=9531 RepID=UPI0005F526FA|nr:PREDICTED: uncharacterized protein LOC105575684 isoform X2 [Cercocebus atys]
MNADSPKIQRHMQEEGHGFFRVTFQVTRCIYNSKALVPSAKNRTGNILSGLVTRLALSTSSRPLRALGLKFLSFQVKGFDLAFWETASVTISFLICKTGIMITLKNLPNSCVKEIPDIEHTS